MSILALIEKSTLLASVLFSICFLVVFAQKKLNTAPLKKIAECLFVIIFFFSLNASLKSECVLSDFMRSLGFFYGVTFVIYDATKILMSENTIAKMD